MIARTTPDDDRLELAAEAHHAAKIALGLTVRPWGELPDWQKHKARVCMAAALRIADRIERDQERQRAA
jgi:hypothetical protein